MKTHGIDHIHFLVTDLEKAKLVTETLVGGPCNDLYGSEDWNIWARYHPRGGFDLFEPIDISKPIFGSGMQKIGVYAIAFRVDDLDLAVEEAQAAGYRIVSRIGSEEFGYGKALLQAQFETRFGVMVELAERGLPEDPLHCPVPDHVDHIEIAVRDLAAAATHFAGLTGSDFHDAVADPRLGALVRMNGLGVRLTQPSAGEGPVWQRLNSDGEGIVSVGLVAQDLNAAVEAAELVGLQVRSRYESQGHHVAELEPSGFFGITLRLVERRSIG